jgi:hypothetical protein
LAGNKKIDFPFKLRGALMDDKATPTPRAARCFTRAIKNAQFVQAAAPHLFATDRYAEGFGTGIPMAILQGLHRITPDSPVLSRHPKIANFLKEHRLPIPGMPVIGPLFNGTIHFVQITFQTSGGTHVVPTAEMQTLVRYASTASWAISDYALQYGFNSLSISPTVITHSVSLPSGAYTKADVPGWVNDIAVQNNLPPESCVFIASPPGVSGEGVPPNGGYHLKANIPYIVTGVHSIGLTVKDADDFFALGVSHEIAEVVVDPNAVISNPEVCDPCDNCYDGFAIRLYFDNDGNYLGSNHDRPPGGFNYDYFICGIVKPAAAGRCPASTADCGYAPPELPFSGRYIAIMIEILTGIIQDGGGIGILGGHPVPIPPWENSEVDILLAVATHNLAGFISKPGGMELQIASMKVVSDVAKKEIQRLEGL